MNKIKKSLSIGLLLSPFGVGAAPLVELFTSQGCYSCPPADVFLGELIEKQPEVVALEFHVDYWDTIHYGAAGVWKDPFSDPSYTLRQRIYNSKRLAGRTGVYTPQMVVNGNTAQVGSSKKAVGVALNKKPPMIDLDAKLVDDTLSVDIKGSGNRGSQIWLAIFDRLRVTDVPRGENHGKTMTNHHVVRQLVSLGDWRGEEILQEFKVAAVNDADHGCAVFIQDESLGQIYGATYCE